MILGVVQVCLLALSVELIAEICCVYNRIKKSSKYNYTKSLLSVHSNAKNH